MRTCAWCGNEFSSNITYQKYCCLECRELATKEKISERYRSNKIKRRLKKDRDCAGGCGSKLSIYNDSNFCNFCLVNNKAVDKMLKELKGFFDYEQK